MVILKRFSQIADSDNVIYNRRSSKGYEIFKSIDEFINSFNVIKEQTDESKEK